MRYGQRKARRECTDPCWAQYEAEMRLEARHDAIVVRRDRRSRERAAAWRGTMFVPAGPAHSAPAATRSGELRRFWLTVGGSL